MIQELKKIKLLQSIEENYLKTILNNNQVVIKRYNKGMVLFEQEASCLTLDIVLQGKLSAHSLTLNGSEVMLFDFKEGYIIGANLLFNDNNLYPMTIYCTEDAEICHITKEGVEHLLKSYAFVIPFIKALSINSKNMNQKIMMVTQKSLRENIQNYLIKQAVEQKSKLITLPITKKQLADMFSVQRPSLFRELKKMKDEGLIIINNKEIKINF